MKQFFVANVHDLLSQKGKTQSTRFDKKIPDEIIQQFKTAFHSNHNSKITMSRNNNR